MTTTALTETARQADLYWILRKHYLTHAAIREAAEIDLAREAVVEAQRAADALLTYRGRDRSARLARARTERNRAEAHFDYLVERSGVSRES